jgi:predicted NBD/HSP70 family sugar kinase
MKSKIVNEVNTTRVLQSIWLSDGTTRTALARELGLVKSTVSRIVTMLIERGLVREASDATVGNGLGRKPVCLEINEHYGHILGLEIQPDFYNAVLVNLRGDVLDTWSGSVSMSRGNVAATFLDIMRRLRRSLRKQDAPLIGVGVALAGIVDQQNGVVVESNPLNITEPVPFARDVQDQVRVPVIVENDANCCCWGELAFRRTSRHNNFLFVLGEFRTGETGRSPYWGIAVGLGLVLDGKVYHGASFSAGEFQSILWAPGNKGQFSITDDEARRIKSDGTIMNRAFHELAVHVAFLVNTLNLTSVVVGGEISEYQDILRPMIHAEIQQNWSYPSEVQCTIEFSSFRKDAVAYGAAGMFLESIFSLPEMFPAPGPAVKTEVSVL